MQQQVHSRGSKTLRPQRSPTADKIPPTWSFTKTIFLLVPMVGMERLSPPSSIRHMERHVAQTLNAIFCRTSQMSIRCRLWMLMP